MRTKSTTLTEIIRNMVKQAIDEAANTNLEVKSLAKQIFLVLKKYGLKPQYKTGEVDFTSNSKPGAWAQRKPDTGFGGRIVVSDDGVIAIAIYAGGVIQSISRGGISGIDPKEVSASLSYYEQYNQKALLKAVKMIQQDINSKIGQKFETLPHDASLPNRNEFGEYVMLARMKP